MKYLLGLLALFCIGLIYAGTITVTLNSPANASTSTTQLVSFNASASSSTPPINNISLYMNNTGTWSLNQTLSLVSSVSDAHGLTIDQSQPLESEKTGMSITIGSRNINLTSVTKTTLATATRLAVYKYDGSYTNLQNATFIGDVATLSSPEILQAGQIYFLWIDNNGLNYTRRYGTGASYPVQETYFNWTSGSNGGGFQYTEAWGVVSIAYNVTADNLLLNKTITSGIIWNVQACDTAGSCGFATNNFTLLLESTPPTISVSSPSTLVSYGSLTTNQTLNFTVTDTNLDKCWFSYNNTNTTVACTSGVQVNTSFPIHEGEYSIRIYANDTAGNLNSTLKTWGYSMLETSRSYNTTTYETDSAYYSINLTANSSLTSVHLVYNGTEYALSNSGGLWSITRQISSSAIGTQSFNYKMTFVGSSYYAENSSQTVSSVLFVACNVTYTTRYVNFTFKDESSLSTINATIPTSTFVYWLGDGTVNKTLTFSNSTANYQYPFCFSVPTRTLNIDSYIQYASTGYPQKIYNPTETTFTNSTTNTTLYLLGDADGLYVTIQVINSAEQLLSGVSVTAVRSLGGADTIVASGTTDDTGSITFWLNPDYSHTFTFTKDGYTDYSTTITPTQTSYTVTMAGGATVPVSYYKGITTNIFPVNSSLINNTNYNFGFQLNSSFWDVDNYGFNLRLTNGTIINGGSSGTEGTLLTLTYNTTNQTRIYLDYYWRINSTYTNGSTYWVVYNTLNTQWSIARFFDDLRLYIDSGFFGLDDFGQKVIVFLVLFITIGTLSYKYGVQDPIFISALIFGVIYFFDYTVGLLPSYVNVAGQNIPHLYTFIASLIVVIMIIREVTR